jgi:excisionase family DNA binding protein
MTTPRSPSPPPLRKGQTYTINEAAALTGLHRNTVRQRIRLGQLEATVQNGKFGEEYRISVEALVRAGMLSGVGILDEEDVLEADFTPEGEETAPAERAPADGEVLRSTLAALNELYQRHEQAMFRLGYMQGELERVKALAESAESLQRDNEARSQEVQVLKSSLEEKERLAREAEALRLELEETRERAREMERLRLDLDRLKEEAARQESVIAALEAAAEKRPWWRFW